MGGSGYKRKGQIMDVIYLVIVLASLILGLFVYRYVTDLFKQEVFNNETITDNESVAFYNSTNDTLWNFADYMPLVIYITYTISIIMLVFLVRGNPAGIVLLLIAVFIIAFISYVFKDTITTIVEEDFLAGYRHEFPITMFILNHLPAFLVATGFLAIVVMFINM